MKKILGLDLGTNSIGWAVVNEAEDENEQSSIVKLGVRVNPLTVDEQQNFEKGKSITTNADRTLKRSMRRNLQRYKLRRENLIEILKIHGFITDNTILAESGNATTFETYRLRAKAAIEEISLEEFARVLLMINKKRGYKSSRKVKNSEEGSLIDGMEVAKKLYEENLTPGQFCLQLINAGRKVLPDFYRSDLQAEFDKIWMKQKEFYSFLTDELKEKLKDKNEKVTWAICAPAKTENENSKFVWKWIETENRWNEEESKTETVEVEKTLVGIKRNGSIAEQKIENFKWREKALTEKIQPEQLIVVLQKINGQINSSSGYLGKISDRSKELYYNNQTVGQYQMAVLDNNPNTSLKNMVFYRQDYLDEFEKLWETQKQFHSELTDELKAEIRDIIIFYQRRLKSQKGLISFCEFESRHIEVEIDGKKKVKTVGSRVIPRSSPLFQEFKIWQTLNNIEVSVKGKNFKRGKQELTLFDNSTEDLLEIKGHRPLEQEEKELLAKELFVRERMTKNKVLELLFENSKELDLNYKIIDGNRTGYALFQAFNKIIEQSGHEPINFNKSAEEIIEYVKELFGGLGWNTSILDFDSDKELDTQEYYQLWHLLYSFEGDNSNTGDAKLIEKLKQNYFFDNSSAKILANVTFLDDYGSLSAKAIRKILPYLKGGNGYDEACVYAGYGKHSKSSLTIEEIQNKVLKVHLDNLPKNSLRNPVVEKILNQMVNVINQLVDEYGKCDDKGEKHFDEIRVELARELKKNAKEREELTKVINNNAKLHEQYRKVLSEAPFNLSHISRNDIIRYKLWQELAANGYKTLYSNTYVSPADLFSGKFDIEHIIPQSRLFDDSFSNKTLESHDVNIKKGNKTAYDFVKEEYGDVGLQEYMQRVERLYDTKKRDEAKEEEKKAGTISKTKYNKLKMTEADIPDGFIERDLRNTQYIAKKALSMLNEITRRVIATSGSVTDELREDWGLVDIMKELNWDKYNKLGLTEIIEEKRLDDQGQEKIYKIRRIKDWTKRNDHRHHAMDALTVAFTKDVYIQYFNNKNASFKPDTNQYAIKSKYFENSKALPPMPLNEFRAEAKRQLENTLISIKAKNKVVTRNVNITKKKNGVNKKIQSTPRGQLHLDTVYGSQRQYVTRLEKVGVLFNAEMIAKVANKQEREALSVRLADFDGDAKKAFTGKNTLEKNPVYLDKQRIQKCPQKVKIVDFETIYTIRKEVSPDLKLDKIVDKGIKTILEQRLKEYGGDAKKAFSNLEENPIWLNKEKDIRIKRVTIKGVSNAVALHDKKDHLGNPILDGQGECQPIDFVNTGNNHHVAIYRSPVFNKKTGEVERDDEGNENYELQEKVVSFFEATARVNQCLPIIDKEYKKEEGWEFLFTMKQNEYFVFPRYEKYMDENDEEKERMTFNPAYVDLTNPDNYAVISPNLFRVQSMSKVEYENEVKRDYIFRHHLETIVTRKVKDVTYKQFKSLSFAKDIVKVRINHIGQIVQVGEY